VNGVAPGVVAFPNEGPDSDPQMQERYLRRVPLARSGTPVEAAEAVRWLALDATYTTGMIVRVDGGRWVA
jgi:pteridine reductase